MTDAVYERTDCRLCGHSPLSTALALPATPIGSDFVAAEAKDRPQEAYPLDLMLCERCGNVQTSHVVPPDIVYRAYHYTSSISLEIPPHFERYANELVERYSLKEGSFVVEMGSNEGMLLRGFKRHGIRIQGVDPAEDIARLAAESGVPTIPDYFTQEMAQQIAAEQGKADLMLANYVYANIDDLNDIMAGVKTLLSPNGVFIIETSYVLDVVERDLIDTIFHEHYSYFAVKPLQAFFKSCGFELIDAESITTKGGSIRLTLQPQGGGRSVSPAVAELIDREEKAGLFDLGAYQALAKRLEDKTRQLHVLIDECAGDGPVAAFGAAVGLTTLMYAMNLGERVEFIVDDNPNQHGKFSPGYHIPVFPSSELLVRSPKCVVVLAWRYAPAIMKKQQAYADQGGRFLLPLPEPAWANPAE